MGLDRRPRPAAAALCPRRSRAARCSLLALPAIQMRMADASPDTYPAQLEVVKTYKRMQQAFPGTALPANVIVKAPNVNAPAVRSAICELERRALASGRAHEPITIGRQQGRHGREHHDPDRRQRLRQASNRSLALLRNTLIPETVGALPDTEAGVTGTDRTVEGLERPDPLGPAACGRVRARVRVRADAGRVPLDRGRAEGDRAELPVGRRGLRRSSCWSSSTASARACSASADTSGDLAGDPAAPVRDPVRPLDGLPRVHRQPDPRAVPAWGDDGRGDLGRDPLDGQRRHERRDRDGLRVRGLRNAVDAVLQAVRRRARSGDPDRRDDRPRRPAAGDDEAARRPELVPAARGSSGCRTSTTASSRSTTSPSRSLFPPHGSRSGGSAPPGSPASC